MSEETRHENVPMTGPCGGDLGREESLCSLMASTFRGKLAWLSVLVYTYILAFMALAVVSAVLFFRAETTRGMILAATGFVVSFIVIVLCKMWYWSLMFRNSLISRIDRLERRLGEMCRARHE